MRAQPERSAGGDFAQERLPAPVAELEPDRAAPRGRLRHRLDPAAADRGAPLPDADLDRAGVGRVEEGVALVGRVAARDGSDAQGVLPPGRDGENRAVGLAAKQPSAVMFESRVHGVERPRGAT